MIPAALLLSILLAPLASDEAPVGARGWGLTVFSGTQPDTFGVEVIGTLRGSVPGESRVLVRLTGTMAESTGVAAGMSGSPVYIGDRLLGALASTFPYSAHPVGMVTPLAAMLRPDSARLSPIQGAHAPLSGSASGFDSTPLGVLSAGLPTAIGFAGGGHEDLVTDLQPGGVAAVVLVDGDWSLAILGTVTWRSGERIAAFGHQLFGFGQVSLPLASGSVIATLANRALPFKMTNAGSVMGAITYDGPSGVLGQVGRRALTIPLSIESPLQGGPVFNLRLAVHPQLTPLLLRACIQNCGGLWGGIGRLGAAARMTVFFADGSSRAVERASAGPGAFAQLSEEMARLLDGMMGSPLGQVVPESVAVAFSSPRGDGVYYLESVAVDGNATPHPEELRLTVRLLRREGSPVSRTVRMSIPPGAALGRLRIQAGDAATVAQWDRERAALTYLPGTLDQYLDRLFSPLRPDRFYLRILSDDRGWSQRGGEVVRLPPAMARVLGRSLQRGLHDVTSMSVISSAEIDLDGPVYGSAVVDLAPSKEGPVP